MSPPPTSPAGNLKPSLRPGLTHAPGWQGLQDPLWQGPFGEVLPMGRGGRGVTRASQWSPNSAGEQGAHSIFFPEGEGEEPSWVDKGPHPGWGGGWWQRVRTTNSLLFLLRTQAGPMRTEDPAHQGLSQAGGRKCGG